MRSTKLSLTLGLFGLMLMCGTFKVEGLANYYDFVLEESNFTRLCSTKSILTVNGLFPGPTITVRKGDTFYVNVHNKGTYGVTLHWHGVKQPRNPWSDGPENITQCPIQPGTNFTYEVILSTEEGTLWWHAHSDWTRATVHGAIVVLPPNGSYHKFRKAPDAQQTIIIASWYKGDVQTIYEQTLEEGGDPVSSDAFTINGQPGDNYTCSNDSTYHLKVSYGKTYLLRVINAVLMEEQFFAIANHTLTVVGQDGAYLKPFTTDYIMITPGQTMDILVTANQTPSYYYMASLAFSDFFLAPYDNTTTTAILQYEGVNVTRPSTIPFPTLPTHNNSVAASNFTSHLRSLDSYGHPFECPKKINQHMLITIAMNLMPCNVSTCSSYTKLASSLNNISFAFPSTSILEAYYRNLSGVFEENFPSNPPDIFNFTDASDVSTYTKYGTKVKMLDYDDNVEIVFQGTNLLSGGNHPMHLHGFSYYLVGNGTGNFNNETDPKNYNLVDPPLINTFGVPKNGWIAVRFKANNPGVWFIHCHIDKHASWGMDTVLIVRNGSSSITSLRPPPPNMPACSS